ncbi:Z1 domain-containing protein [Exiguobacterium flavidum]|uniref:Z1 domain-containing protein n=1 Tax=Exiguobacterium flavidum TaxID=2184695 RepID=UPI000DF7BD34|nr:Z1 domain-containing protein [Exiguobacterium flavidum]
MEKNVYQVIKKQVENALATEKKPLAEGQINLVIDKCKDLVSNKQVLQFLFTTNGIENFDGSEQLDEMQWSRMIRELETEYDVESKVGIVVTGDRQKERDNTWWSSKKKVEQENYYSERYKKYMGENLPADVLKSIDEDTDVIMNHIGNPEEDQFERYGMVVGHVQSGKTGNYSSLVCKAADAGYKFIVVIAGAMNNLRNQTQERLNYSFIGRDLYERVGVGNQSKYREDKRPISLTSKTKDFNKRDADSNSQGISLDTISSPVIVVIKKNTKTLDNVISWINTHYSQGVVNHAMLLIDDESDYASINTKEEEDPTKINEKIRALLKLFRKSSYVAYTATPYANIFIDHRTDTKNLGKDLFPEDFIYALNAPSNYLGAEKIYLDPQKKHFCEIDDSADLIPSKHKKDYEVDSLPESLEDAIRLFILNVAIRHLRDQENQHNSMLIHASRFTAVHQSIAKTVNKYYELIRQHLTVDGNKENVEVQNKQIQKIKDTFDKHYTGKIEFDWKTILFKVTEIIGKIQIYEVHKDTKVKLEYRKDFASNVIVIGGTSLSRGYTLEGLSVSYFLRNTIFYDTLMQMGRWFGYRPGYEDLCKVYMNKETFDNFRTITEATLDLVDDLKEMSRQEMTPRDFGLAVKQHPDSGLQVTARNKLKNSGSIDFEMKLDGHLKETSWILKDRDVNENNTLIIKNTIKYLNEEHEQKKERYWTNISRDTVGKFLDEFKIYEQDLDDFGMRSKLPIKFIRKYIDQVDTEWDVALYSGNSDQPLLIEGVNGYYQERKVTDRGSFYEVEHRQVSSGNAEFITLDKEQILEIKKKKEENTQKRKAQKDEGIKDLITEFSVRKAVRQSMDRPLLMLHLISAQVKGSNRTENLAAFGISFPGGIQSSYGNVKLQVNTVYIQSMMEEEEGDDF